MGVGLTQNDIPPLLQPQTSAIKPVRGSHAKMLLTN
jgi:hypothetical protein